MSMRGQSALLNWQEDEVFGPDVMRRETLLLLAKMTSNTYYEPYKRGWYNLTDDWDVVRQPPPSASCADAVFLIAVVADV